MVTKRDIHISIVSHGQGRMVEYLLGDLAELACCLRLQVTLTKNLSEPNPFVVQKTPFPTLIIENKGPQGFGANHNAAFSQAPLPNERCYFIVVNPDVRVQEDVLTPLVAMLEHDKETGIAAPFVWSLSGKLEDSARYLPTPAGLFSKFFGQQGRWAADETEKYFQPDWVAGMFMGFRAEVFNDIGGFDEGYFLYYEDVDLCSRLWLKGFSVQVDSTISVIHDARRSSRRNLRYLIWHLASIARFFSSDVYRQVKKLHSDRM